MLRYKNLCDIRTFFTTLDIFNIRMPKAHHEIKSCVWNKEYFKISFIEQLGWKFEFALQCENDLFQLFCTG